MMRRFQVNKFNSHADARFHDSNHAERFNLLVPACEGDSDPGIGRERPARANECPAHGDVGGYTLRLCSAFQVQQLNICRKRIAKYSTGGRVRPGPARRLSMFGRPWRLRYSQSFTPGSKRAFGYRGVSGNSQFAPSILGFGFFRPATTPKRQQHRYRAGRNLVPSRYYLERQSSASPSRSPGPAMLASIQVSLAL